MISHNTLIYNGTRTGDSLITSIRFSHLANSVPSFYIFKRYKPQEVVDVLDNAIFRTEKINPTRYKTLQELSNQGTRYTNSAIVGKIRDGEHIFVKTGYKNK